MCQSDALQERLEACAALSAFLHSQPAVPLFSPLVQAASFNEKGVGLRLLTSAEKGDVLVCIPASLCFSAEAALASPQLGPLLRACPRSVREDDALACLLLWERALGAASERRHHLASLPIAYDATLFWNERELEELQASPLRAVAARLLEQTEGDYAELKTLSLLPAEASLAEYRWALATVHSRAMDLPVSENGGLERFVVPFIDLANNDSTLSVCHAFERAERSVVLLAGRDGIAGDEVCITYGESLDAAAFLRLHGFIPEQAGARVPVYAELQPAAPQYESKRALLADAGVAAGQPHELSADVPLPPLLLAAVRALHLTEEEVEGLGCDGGRLVGPRRVSFENEASALGTLRGALGKMLAAYPTSVLEDELMLMKPSPARRTAAIRLRLAEKKVLAAALAELEEREVEEERAVADKASAQAGAAPLQAYFEQLLKEEQGGAGEGLANELD